MNRHRLLERLLATLAASAMVGTGCSGSSIEENGDGAAGTDDDVVGTGGLVSVGGTSSGTSSVGGTSLGGTGNVGQGGAAGVSTRGGTGASTGGDLTGGAAGVGGTLGGAGATTGGTPPTAGAGAGGVMGGVGGTTSGGAGSGGQSSCGCPMKCYEWNAVPQNMGGAGGSVSAIIGFAGAGFGGSGALLPCPVPSAVAMGPLCGGSAPPAVLGPVVVGPTRQGQTCCYSVTATCAGGAGGVPGRPFLVEGEARVASVSERADWTGAVASPPMLPEPLRQRLGRAWLDDALLEHASVAAFARFTLELLALGAPPELVQASQSAALDEIEHAKLCFAAASRYFGRAVGPATLDVRGAIEPADLVAFARRTFEEGCVGETLAALLAGEALGRAKDPFVRRLLERIVEDETRHAELAWRAVRWAIASGGAPVLEALERAFVEIRANDSLEASCADHDDARDDAWHDHGRLTPAEIRVLRTQGLREVVAPCIEALRSSRPSRYVARAPSSPIMKF